MPVALAPIAVEAVKAYLRVRTPGKNQEADKYLFISRQGLPLNYRMAYNVVKECATWAGIEKKVYPHLLRHGKLSDLTEQDVNPWRVMKFAGQRSIRSLQPYIRSGKGRKQRKTIAAIPLLRPSTNDGEGEGCEPTVRIDDAPEAGAAASSDAVVMLSKLLADGKIGADTCGKALDALMRKEAAR